MLVSQQMKSAATDLLRSQRSERGANLALDCPPCETATPSLDVERELRELGRMAEILDEEFSHLTGRLSPVMEARPIAPGDDGGQKEPVTPVGVCIREVTDRLRVIANRMSNVQQALQL